MCSSKNVGAPGKQTKHDQIEAYFKVMLNCMLSGLIILKSQVLNNHLSVTRRLFITILHLAHQLKYRQN